MEKSEKKEFLDPKSKISSMRWVMLKITPVIIVLLLLTPVVMVIDGYTNKGIDWMGAASFITSLGIFITGMLGMKAVQKKNE